MQTKSVYTFAAVKYLFLSFVINRGATFAAPLLRKLSLIFCTYFILLINSLRFTSNSSLVIRPCSRRFFNFTIESIASPLDAADALFLFADTESLYFNSVLIQF